MTTKNEQVYDVHANALIEEVKRLTLENQTLKALLVFQDQEHELRPPPSMELMANARLHRFSMPIEGRPFVIGNVLRARDNVIDQLMRGFMKTLLANSIIQLARDETSSPLNLRYEAQAILVKIR